MKNNEVIYLNNATTSFPKSPLAIEVYNNALSGYVKDVRHYSGGDNDITKCKEIVGDILNIEKNNIFFSYGATLAINEILQGYLSEGDSCIVDNRSHNAVIRTLYNIKNISYVCSELYTENDVLDSKKLISFVNNKTKLICLTQASNVTGTIYSLKNLLSTIKDLYPGVAIFIDACQSAGLADLNELSLADFIVFPSHKYICSVPGAAILIVKRKLKSIIYGGTGINSNELDVDVYGGTLNHVEVGTQNIPAIKACVAAFKDAEKNKVAYLKKINSLSLRLWDGLNCINNIETIGNRPSIEHNGIVSFIPKKGHSEIIWARHLASNGIIVRGGLHCSVPQHEQLNLLTTGTVRLSIGRYNTEDEIDFALNAIEDFSNALNKTENNSNDMGGVLKNLDKEEFDLRSFVSIEQVSLCAEDPDLVNLEGKISKNDLLNVIKSNAENLNWYTTLIDNSMTLVAQNGKILFLVNSDGRFSLSQVLNKEHGENLLLKLCFGGSV